VGGEETHGDGRKKEFNGIINIKMNVQVSCILAMIINDVEQREPAYE
jgi:hypothetical protein